MSATATRRSDSAAVRDEDAFDVAAVDTWLRERVPGLADGLPAVKQFTGGASNLTYQLDYPDRKLILRRPPAGRKAASAHDMKREHDVQAGLRGVFPYVPEMVAYCPADGSPIDSEFYVMKHIDGLILRRGDRGEQLGDDPATARRVCVGAFDRLIELHAVDPAAAGLDHLGKGAGYVRRQVDGWSDRYRNARTWNVPRFSKVMKWLDANQPADVGTCIIHNDFRLDNLILDRSDPANVIGILDWELATIGDPLMDLGGAMSYWLQADDPGWAKRFQLQPSTLPGMLTRHEIVDYYRDKTGLAADNWVFYEVFGVFRLAAIIQQIYYRYHHKQTHNPAFKQFWLAVHLLHRRARQLIRHA